MKYKTLPTSDPKIIELQSQYKSTEHVIHFVVTMLFTPWVIVWIVQGVGNKIDNTEIDNKIEDQSRMLMTLFFLRRIIEGCFSNSVCKSLIDSFSNSLWIICARYINVDRVY